VPTPTDQKVAAILAVMAKSARSMVIPACYVCRRDGIFDRTARHPAAAVRVGICREPYVLDVCERHLGPLQATLPTGGLWVIERYRRQPDGQPVHQPSTATGTHRGDSEQSPPTE
jgi:hypothetical protein